MPYKQVIRAKKLGGQFAGHSRQHARRVATSATEPFRDRLSPDREFLDLYEYQIALGDELELRHTRLIAIVDRHDRQLERDRQLREQRDGWMADLREDLLQLKDTFDGHYGRGSARAVFQEDPPRIPDEAEAVHQLGKRVFDTLIDPGFDLEPTQQGVVVNPKLLARSFEEPLTGLGATLRVLHDSESVTRHTQSLKDTALERAEEFDGKVARFYEAFYDLAGHELLANRLRRSSHARRQAESTVADSTAADSTAAAAGDAVASAAETEGATPSAEAAEVSGEEAAS